MSSDRELVRRFLAGDERAFSVLYDRHSPKLFMFALRLVGGIHADAEEVIQETWLRAAARMNDFRWESALGTWLHGINLNCARELMRARSSRPNFGQQLYARPRRTADGIDLERAIAQLPEELRLVLVLYDLEGYPHEEIAARLDIAPGTSRSRLSRARQQVRELLTPTEER